MSRSEGRGAETASADVRPVDPSGLVSARADDDSVTALLLAGEELAAPLRVADRMADRAPNATPTRPPANVPEDFAWMVNIARHAAMCLAEDPNRSSLASELSYALGDGDALSMLFGRFLPASKPPILMDATGRPILTRRQVEMLREAAHNLTHAEIASRLGISTRTVSTHMDRIYRRLGVNKSMQAVARAVALGYLDLDAVSFVRAASSSDLRDFSTLHALLAQSESAEALPGGPSLRRLAQFGLLLMLAAAAAATVLRSDETADVPMIGIVCRLDSSGKVRAAFGGDRLRSARAVTIGPPACADHGFAPGAVYVVNEALAQSGLNTAEIVEYSFPGGDAPPTVRSFAGSREVGTRLSDVASLTFDTSGRLLAACGALTNGLLAFTEGGARVSRLASVRASQVAVAESGLIYAAASAPDGARIETMAPDGRHVRTLVSAPLDARYAGIAVGHDGRILVNRVERGRGAIEEFTTEGEPSRLFTAPGIRDARLCVDRQGHILAACPATCDVRVFQADGRPLRRIPLESIVTPSSVAVADDGAIWVSGQAE